MRLALAISAAVLGLLAACGDDGGTPDSCLPECAADRGYDAVSYHLSASFDWDAKVLHAVEDLTVIPAAPIIEPDADLEVAKVHAGGQLLAYANDREAGTLHVDLTPILGDGGPVDFTVEYTAETSDSLVAPAPRDDDPVTSRVVYTDSEPDRGLRWLAAKHDPSDRALWSVDVTVAVGEDAVANGTRAGDQVAGPSRLVSYHLDHPIPTYLMAFAAGELDHAERTTGPVPLALWFRRGLMIRPDDNLDAVADAMATFGSLIGPYPWDSYAVVLLPGFGGGMENATITFNDESSGQGVVGFSLNAHELAHHWFGDWVTMRHYDDVWVKEGMATFLAAEATRASRDREHTGRFYGANFGFYSLDAIVDVTLTGFDKYTSGPYERAAWLITQVRALVGEDAFWAGLRRVQTEHAVGDIDGPGFLQSFAPALTDADRAHLAASLPLIGIPLVEAAAETTAGVTTATFTLGDPQGLLTAPVEVAVIDAAGLSATTTLIANTPSTIVVPDGGYLALDPRGQHPAWPSIFDVGDVYYEQLAPRMAPGTAATSPASLTWGSRAPSHQEIALQSGAPLPGPADFPAFYEAIDSVEAQASALESACAQLQDLTGVEHDTLADYLIARLIAPPVTRFAPFSSCGPALVDQALRAEFDAAYANPTAASAARLEYLMSFDYGPALSLDHMAHIARTAPSLRLRDLALTRLLDQTYQFAFTPISPAEAPAWRDFFRERLPVTTSAGRLQRLWRAEVNLRDLDALPVVAPLIHSVAAPDYVHVQIVCDAYRLGSPTPGVWEAFQAATMPWSTLAPAVAATLADPTQCDAFKPAPPPAAADDDHQRHLSARR